MSAIVLSTNVGSAEPSGVPRYTHTGIHKRAMNAIEVRAPGPNIGDGSGVAGDFVGDREHHGGQHKAVYAFAREELDWWQTELGRDLGNGAFGENLTTAGIDVDELLIGTRLRVGADAVLEVTCPRQPCRTFAEAMGERAWVRRFTERCNPGAYLAVVHPGRITAGDNVEVAHTPSHDVTIRVAFRALLGDPQAAKLCDAAGCLPPRYSDRVSATAARA